MSSVAPLTNGTATWPGWWLRGQVGHNLGLPSGKRTYGRRLWLPGKLSINGSFSIAMFSYHRVHHRISHGLSGHWMSFQSAAQIFNLWRFAPKSSKAWLMIHEQMGHESRYNLSSFASRDSSHQPLMNKFSFRNSYSGAKFPQILYMFAFGILSTTISILYDIPSISKFSPITAKLNSFFVDDLHISKPTAPVLTIPELPTTSWWLNNFQYYIPTIVYCVKYYIISIIYTIPPSYPHLIAIESLVFPRFPNISHMIHIIPSPPNRSNLIQY